MKKTDPDVIIIGAGAAGLTCAHELMQKNLDVLVLEAKPRIGGRIHTMKDAFDSTPLELGAEFIHGNAPELMQLSETFCMNFYDVLDSHLMHYKGKLHKDDKFREELASVMKKLDAHRKQDRSVSEFLKTHHFSEKMHSLFVSFVEGFNAADLKLFSEKALAATHDADDAMFRFSHGYCDLINNIFKTFDHNSVRLNTVVKTIDWGKSGITLYADCLAGHNTYKCKMLVVTLPLGVLQSFAGSASAVEWRPSQPEPLHEALSAIQMGDAQKIIFRFRSRFWERLSDQPVSFMHLGPENYFPTWWSFLPLRSPHLTAWQGGAKATEMALWKPEKRIEEALNSLSLLTKKSIAFLRSEILEIQTHDWSNDPYARGAYSYVLQNGLEKSRLLEKPFKNKIFFAGEATVSGPDRGTVHGAIASGQRAAADVLKTLKIDRVPAALLAKSAKSGVVHRAFHS
jgi:monoamine oxidase